MGADLKNAHVVGLKWAETSNGRQVGHVFGRRSARSIARRTMRLARPCIRLRRLLPCIALTCENMPSQVHPGQACAQLGALVAPTLSAATPRFIRKQDAP